MMADSQLAAQKTARYLDLLETGPFPNRVDPWVERGYYFHQLHGAMISELMNQVRRPLLERGYLVAREASLQVTDQGEPDFAVYRQQPYPALEPIRNYGAVAESLAIDPGIAVDWEMPELDAIFIKEIDGGLVTVVEIISPSNKANNARMRDYLQRRMRLIERQGVNFVELDLTRSFTRVFFSPLADNYAYHIGIYLPYESARLIGVSLEERLKPFVLPLRHDGLAVDTHDGYIRAYRGVTACLQINKDLAYSVKEIPFPSLITDNERKTCMEAVEGWKAEVEHLREEARDT
jgi:Protein of unknown function (DUF4058)